MKMEFHLPIAKVHKICFLLEFVLSKKKVCLKLIQSLLGFLAFTSRVIPVGRIFPKTLYLAIAGITSPGHFVRITASVRDDLEKFFGFV